jgi:hypothetical protein
MKTIRINCLPMKPIEEYSPREQEKLRRLGQAFRKEFQRVGAVRKHATKEPTNGNK